MIAFVMIPHQIVLFLMHWHCNWAQPHFKNVFKKMPSFTDVSEHHEHAHMESGGKKSKKLENLCIGTSKNISSLFNAFSKYPK